MIAADQAQGPLVASRKCVNKRIWAIAFATAGLRGSMGKKSFWGGKIHTAYSAQSDLADKKGVSGVSKNAGHSLFTVKPESETPLQGVVGATGIEPVTPTMSR